MYATQARPTKGLTRNAKARNATATKATVTKATVTKATAKNATDSNATASKTSRTARMESEDGGEDFGQGLETVGSMKDWTIA
jgi:hypothetical protein